MLNKIKTNYNT